jgi:transposase
MMSKAQAARTFGVGATSVKRYVKHPEEGKPLTPGKAPGKKGKLDGNARRSCLRRICMPARLPPMRRERSYYVNC